MYFVYTHICLVAMLDRHGSTWVCLRETGRFSYQSLCSFLWFGYSSNLSALCLHKWSCTKTVSVRMAAWWTPCCALRGYQGDSNYKPRDTIPTNIWTKLLVMDLVFITTSARKRARLHKGLACSHPINLLAVDYLTTWPFGTVRVGYIIVIMTI